MRSPLKWYGGKGLLAPWLSQWVPDHTTYVEPFAGGASLFFAKQPSPVEILNDLHSELVNFYRVLRENGDQLTSLLTLTPFSREEYLSALNDSGEGVGDVERARRFFVVARQSMAGGGSRSGWSRSVTNSFGGMAKQVSAWIGAVDGLPQVVARLRAAQIENQPWSKLLDLYDTPDTLWYLDPPYVLETRSATRYYHDFDDAHQADLVARIRDLTGFVMLSGYDSPAYAGLVEAGWECQRRELVTAARFGKTSSDRPRVTEVLWMNYRFEEMAE